MRFRFTFEDIMTGLFGLVMATMIGLVMSLPTDLHAVESPCYWQGSQVKCLPSSGIFLSNSRTLRLGTDNETNYIELAAPASMVGNLTFTWPTAYGGLAQVLTASDTSGALGWSDPGITPSGAAALIAATDARHIADLVCHSNITVSGVQTCDGQLTSGASYVLLMAQTATETNGLWATDDFGSWTQLTTGGQNAGGLFTITDGAGGTTYSDTLWLGFGDGGSTNNFRLIPTTGSNVQLTASRAVVTDANSHLVQATTTATEIGYVNGVTSAIQTQLNAKSTNPGTTTGDIDYCSNTATPCTLARLGIGASTTVLHGGTTPSYSQVVNADVSASAAIAYSKLSLTTSIVNGDISASAAIVGSKLVTASADATATGVVTSFIPTVKSKVKTVSSANYTVLDNDGFDTLVVTTGSSNRTMTLPTAADNAGREIWVKKADSGTGTVIVDGEGAETIDGATTQTLYTQYGWIHILCDATTWHIEGLVETGAFTASYAGLANVAAVSSSTTAQFMREKNVVTVSGSVDIDPTATVLTSISISLPIPSALTDERQLSGTGVGDGSAYQPGRVFGRAATDDAQLSYIALDLANKTHSYHFTYLVL